MKGDGGGQRRPREGDHEDHGRKSQKASSLRYFSHDRDHTLETLWGRLNIMRFLKVLSLAACGLFAGALTAQVGVYALATGQHMSNVKFSSSTNPWTLTGDQKGDYSPLGYTVGGYYDFRNFGPSRFGVDVRASSTTSKKGVNALSSSNGGRIYAFQAGGRFSFLAHYKALHISPYLEGVAGLARTNYGVLSPVRPGPTVVGRGALTNNFTVSGLAGVDVALGPVMDLRLEGGSGIVHGNGESTPLQTFSVGIVFHGHRTPQ